MCGIAGILNTSEAASPDVNTIMKMVNELRHRGPDDHGYYTDKHIGLGHARLSIIDISGGHQPIHNTDKNIWIVFNGEIFNYFELRKELLDKGYRFYTQTDTEVIVHLYDEYGKDFVNKLNGQFAIALWDKRRRQLVLVRDRVGIVPLFYTRERNHLLFGSEIKSILTALDSKPDIDLNSLDQIFTFWSPISPNTFFKGVLEVQPGERIICDTSGRMTKDMYWKWDYPQTNDYRMDTDDILAEELQELLIDATRIRLRSDVPVAAYLSGGLDSSVLVAIIKRFTDNPLRTFSIGFEDKGLDESEYQKSLIDYLDAEHSRINCQPGDIADNFIQAIWHTELPILRSAPVPMSLLSGLVHESGYKVVLTGEGSDEVLGGYDIFKESKIRQFWARDKNSTLRPTLLKRLYPYLDVSPGKSQVYLQKFFGVALDTPELLYFSHIPRWITTSQCKSFFSAELKCQLSDNAISNFEESLPSNMNRWHAFNRAQYIEAKSLMPGYLLCSQGDRMLMKNSVEGRFPFLDHRVIEFASKLHPKYKMKALNEKYLLKKSLGKYIPDEIVNRHKQPYRAPDIASFMGKNAREYINDLLDSSELNKYRLFDVKKVKMLRNKIDKGNVIGFKDNMAFMGILSTQAWASLFIDH